MLRGVWQALNSLSIHVTFTAIVPGAYTGEAKMCKNMLKWRTFKLPAWITGKRLKIDGYIQRGFLQALIPLSNRVTFTAIVPGAYPGESKNNVITVNRIKLQQIIRTKPITLHNALNSWAYDLAYTVLWTFVMFLMGGAYNKLRLPEVSEAWPITVQFVMSHH